MADVIFSFTDPGEGWESITLDSTWVGNQLNYPNSYISEITCPREEFIKKNTIPFSNFPNFDLNTPAGVAAEQKFKDQYGDDYLTERVPYHWFEYLEDIWGVSSSLCRMWASYEGVNGPGLNNDATLYIKDECSSPELGSGEKYCCDPCSFTLSTMPAYRRVVNQRDAAELSPRDQPIMTPDGAFTISQYAQFIPIVFGTDRLTGNVFWSGGFTTSYVNQNDQPYYYTKTSFALGIAEGEIDAVLRLWVGDKLIIDNSVDTVNNIVQPGPAGYILSSTYDLTSDDSPLRTLTSADVRSTKITVFRGSEYELPSEVMGAKDGYALTPAYRGLAYILFENFIVTNNTIPAIKVEIAANSNPLVPRIFTTLPIPVDKFDATITGPLAFDPSYRQFIVPARNTLTSQTGVTVRDGNNLAEYDQFSYQGITLTDTDGLYVLQSGHVVVAPYGQARLSVIDPFTGAVLSELTRVGPFVDADKTAKQAGTYFNLPGGCWLLNTTSVADMGDVVCLFGKNETGSGARTDFVLCSISPTGRIGVEYVNSTKFDFDTNISCRVSVPQEMAGLFPDGQSTFGQHIFVFSGNTDEVSGITVTRVNTFPLGKITAPLLTDVGYIPCEQLGGAGIGHNVVRAFRDEADNNIVLMITTDLPGQSDIIAKWSPFTQTLVWVRRVTAFDVNGMTGSPTEVILDSTFAWIGSDTKIYSCDTQTGNVRVIVEDFAAQNLPLPRTDRLHCSQIYNGFENTITYLSVNAQQPLIKVFLERTSRTTVPISDIVVKLLQRVGLDKYLLDVANLTAAETQGYTVTSRQTLRSILSTLAQVFKFDVVESNGRLLYSTRGNTPALTVPATHLGDVSNGGYWSEDYEAEFGRNRKLNLTYRDIDRDYGDNVQTISLPKFDGSKVDDDIAIDVSVPIVLDADRARRLAEVLLYAKITYQATYQGALPPQYAALDPGDVVNFAFDTGTITVRVRDVTVGDDKMVKIRATPEDPDIYNDEVNIFGNTGQFLKRYIKPTAERLDPYLIPVPALSQDNLALGAAQRLIHMCYLPKRETTVAVPSAPLVMDIVTQTKLDVPPPTTYPTWGYVISSLPPWRQLFTTDYSSVLRVRIAHMGQYVPQTVSKETLLNIGVTCNMAIVGKEVIQFERAINEGNDVWRFEGLHRARLMTEIETLRHRNGEYFILCGNSDGILDAASFSTVAVENTVTADMFIKLDVDSNNPFQPTLVTQYRSRNRKAPMVAGFQHFYLDDDAVKLTWHKRNRYDVPTGDDFGGGADTPAATEDTVTYTVYIVTGVRDLNPDDPTTYVYKEQVLVPEITFSAATLAQIPIDINFHAVYCWVVQDGTPGGFETSDPAPHLIPKKA